MYRNYRLYAAIAILAMVGATIMGYEQADDWFAGLRPRSERAVRESGEPVGVVFQPVETESGSETFRVRPVEGALRTTGNITSTIFGGSRSNRYDDYRE